MLTIFETPGTFDLRSLDTFGMNAKPNSSNPIGYFGTGLKMAIAVLLRNGAHIDLYCNGDHYSFYTKHVDFRGEGFLTCCYKRTNGFLKLFHDNDLPYTTELGKNWELWMAFRELYANTLDENGTVYTIEDNDEPPYGTGSYSEGKTWIVIDHREFWRFVETKNTIIMDPQRETITEAAGIGNVSEGQSQNLYYRGMRAFDLPEDEPAMFTWNVIEEQELTEDRSIKSLYSYRDSIKNLVQHSNDEKLIKAVLTAPKETFEGTLNFAYGSKSDTFEKVLIENRNSKSLNHSAHSYYDTWLAPPAPPKKDIPDNIWSRIMKALNDASTLCLNGEPGDYPERETVEALFMKAFEKEFDR